jgi:tRNA-dihydrouridine synthase B
MHIPVFGNGDVNTLLSRRLKCGTNTELDGAMIGRASIGNPWFFNEVKQFLQDGNSIWHPPRIEDKVAAARRHLANGN